MRILAGILVAVAAVTIVTSADATSTQPTATPTVATVDDCHFAPDKTARYVEFFGQMGVVPGTKRMQMRFDMYMRRGHGHFRRLRFQPTGFGVWKNTSDPGSEKYKVRKQVTDLIAPADYRAIVRFRWLDSQGNVLKSARQRTSTCRQPDLRPNLTIADFTAQPSAVGATQARYLVTVANAGRSDAGAFDVDISVDGVLQPAQTLTSLAAGMRQVLAFDAPRCTPGGAGIRVRVDPGRSVGESVERDNTQTYACPGF